ncbi:MAG: adenosylcobinamide-GDP ribazoletransferase [Candidatus Omnitrophica bacterium]|nr:adenosylcobinamide-GDP ribazoletransferase [Candidatus Omnitrophota bacterium]
MKKITPSLQDAVAFLTVVPFSCPLASGRPAELLGRAMAWFPLVGGLVGAAGAAVILWASGLWPQQVAALLGLGLMALLTGGIHLDGFADTADGFAAWKGREETLRIMQDSRVGSAGASALFLLLGLKWALLSVIPLHAILAAGITAGVLSRLALVLSAQAFPYVPGKSGLGRLVTDRRSPVSVAAAFITALLAALTAQGFLPGLFVLSAAVALAWGFNTLVVRRLGGITGDTLGAVGEIVEVGVLLLLAMR